jgi:hypothetical protein
MTLYHGSNTIVETPRLIVHNRFLDFGNGFYTTPNKDQAVKFAQIVVQRRGGTEIVSMYDIMKFPSLPNWIYCILLMPIPRGSNLLPKTGVVYITGKDMIY